MADIQITSTHLFDNAIPVEITEAGHKIVTNQCDVKLLTKESYVPEDINVTTKFKVDVDVPAGFFGNAAAGSTVYEENTDDTTIIPAEGALYINAGWYPNTKITLGHMIPDDDVYVNAGTNHILAGYEAYDTDGKKLIGTLATVEPTFKGGAVTINGGTLSVTKATASNSVSGAFTTTTGAGYGVTTTRPSTGSDGTNFLAIENTLNVESGSVSGSVSADRATVQYDTNTTGNIVKASDDIALAAATGVATKNISGTVAVDTTGNTNAKFYIPIVNPAGTGGAVTKTSGTGSVTGDNPTVTVSESGDFTTAANYGVKSGTTGNWTGTDGADYLEIKTTGTPGAAKTWSGTATITTTRAAVKYNNDYKGAISKTTADTFLAESTNAGNVSHTISGSVNADVTGGKTYRIKIVNPEGTGGGVTGSGSGTVTGTKPSVNISHTGSFTTNSNFGIQNTAISGTDGADYLKLSVTGTPGEAQSWSGTATVDYTRAAVTSADTYQGAVNMSPTTQLLESEEGTLDASITASVQAQVTGTASKDYYVPIVSIAADGGGVSLGTASVTGTGNIDVTPTVGFYSGTGSAATSSTTALSISTYGITTTAPTGTSGSYVRIDPDATAGAEKTVSFSQSVTRAAVLVNGAKKGLINVADNTQLIAADNTHTASGSGKVGTSIAAGTNYYVPIVSIAAKGGGVSLGTASVTGTGNIDVTPSVTITKNATTTSAISDYGILTSAPSSGNYVTINPDATAGAEKTVSFSQQITRAAVLVNGAKKGLINVADGASLIAADTTQTASGSGKVGTSIAAGTNYYIPESTHTMSVVEGTTTDVTINSSMSNATAANTNGTTLLDNTNLNYAGNYIKFTPGYTSTAGSVKATAKCTSTAGVTTAGNHTSTEKSISVSASSGTTTSYTMKVYKGAYQIDGGAIQNA